MAFIRKRIDLTFRLGTGSFGEGGSNTVKVSNCRVDAAIIQTHGLQGGTAQVKFYGLTKSVMNQLSALNVDPNPIIQRNNTILIEAGDMDSALAIVFKGQINLGQIDLSNPPFAALNVVAVAGSFIGVKPIPPSTYPDTADAAVIMQNLAAQAGYTFENNGVSVILSTPYFPGTIKDQIEACRRAAHINAYIENETTLAIWPIGASRKGEVVEISAGSGLIGYPSFSSGTGGLTFKTRFNPLLRIGNLVKVVSDLEVANRTWTALQIEHNLESETPNGQWFTQFNGVVPYGNSK